MFYTTQYSASNLEYGSPNAEITGCLVPRRGRAKQNDLPLIVFDEHLELTLQRHEPARVVVNSKTENCRYVP